MAPRWLASLPPPPPAAAGVGCRALLPAGWPGVGSRGPEPALRHALPSPPSLQGPLPLMEEMYKKHGEVFTIPLAHKNMTFVIGPHASPHFFNATDDKMSQTEVRSRAGSTGGCRLQGGRGGGKQKQAKPCRCSALSPPLLQPNTCSATCHVPTLTRSQPSPALPPGLQLQRAHLWQGCGV